MSDETLSFDLFHPQPLLIVISGPSGVGKDAVIRALQKRGLDLHVVVTMTDREPRDNEVDGYDYIFVSHERFKELIAQGAFLEHAVVYGDLKGVPRDQIRDAMASNKDVIMRVDVQGAETFREICPEAVTIFLIPTSEKEWHARLKNRNSESEEALEKRMSKIGYELEQLPNFDYVVVNAQDRLEDTVDAIIAIIQAEHHRVHPRKFNI